MHSFFEKCYFISFSFKKSHLLFTNTSYKTFKNYAQKKQDHTVATEILLGQEGRWLNFWVHELYDWPWLNRWIFAMTFLFCVVSEYLNLADIFQAKNYENMPVCSYLSVFLLTKNLLIKRSLFPSVIVTFFRCSTFFTQKSVVFLKLCGNEA